MKKNDIYKGIFYDFVIVNIDEYILRFHIYEISSIDDEIRYYHSNMHSTGPEYQTSNIQEAVVRVKVTIKWDECSDIYYPQSLHFCESEQYMDLNKCITECYSMANNYFTDKGYW